MSKGGQAFRKSGDWFHPHFREIIRAMMKRDGRDFNQCELCPVYIPDGKYEIHHTKYEGATYYDLRIVCSSCNHKPENCLLS
jgi:hypothetical protein